MAFNTKLELSRQARIDSGNIFTPNGSISIGEDFFIKNVQLYIDDIISDQTLVYNPILSRLEPRSLNINVDGYKVLFGIDVSQNVADKLCFDVGSGIFINNGTAYNYSGSTANPCISSGDSAFTRYDILYISGTTGATVDVVQGVPSLFPIVPQTPDLSVLVAIIQVPSGHTSTGSTNLVITSTSTPVSASDVSYIRGSVFNVAQALDYNYVYPILTSFNHNLSEVEYGDTATTVTLEWVRNKTVISQDLVGISTPLTPSQNSVSLTSQVITANTSNSGYTYNIELNDGITTSINSVKIPFFNKIYYGFFSSDTITSSEIINNLTSESENSLNINSFEKIVTGNSEYFYIAYPNRYADKPLFKNEKTYSNYTSYTQSLDNQFSFSENYRILRTTEQLSGEHQFNTFDKTDTFEYVLNSEIVNSIIESLSANSLSANTIFSGSTNLLDIITDTTDVITGGTYVASSSTLNLFTKNGVDIPITGFTITDTVTTGGTFIQSASTITFNRSDGITYDVTGISSSDIFTTGGTFSGGVITFVNNTGGTYSVSGISSSDTFITGGTYTASSDTISLNDNTGGTINISGVTILQASENENITGQWLFDTLRADDLQIQDADTVIYRNALESTTSNELLVGGGYSLVDIPEIKDLQVNSFEHTGSTTNVVTSNDDGTTQSDIIVLPTEIPHPVLRIELENENNWDESGNFIYTGFSAYTSSTTFLVGQGMFFASENTGYKYVFEDVNRISRRKYDGSDATNYRQIFTSGYTATTTDATIDVFTSSTITLFSAIGKRGQKLSIAKSFTGGTVNVETVLSQTIYTTSGLVTGVTLTNGEGITIQSTNTNWRLL